MYKCAGCPNEIKATELHGVKGNKRYCLDCLRRIAKGYQERTLIALLKI